MPNMPLDRVLMAYVTVKHVQWQIFLKLFFVQSNNEALKRMNRHTNILAHTNTYRHTPNKAIGENDVLHFA